MFYILLTMTISFALFEMGMNTVKGEDDKIWYTKALQELRDEPNSIEL